MQKLAIWLRLKVMGTINELGTIFCFHEVEMLAIFWAEKFSKVLEWLKFAIWVPGHSSSLILLLVPCDLASLMPWLNVWLVVNSWQCLPASEGFQRAKSKRWWKLKSLDWTSASMPTNAVADTGMGCLCSICVLTISVLRRCCVVRYFVFLVACAVVATSESWALLLLLLGTHPSSSW